MKNELKAGSGKSIINIPEAFFPMEKFDHIHDQLHVRTVIIKAGEPAAIVSVEMTSLVGPVIGRLKALVSEVTDIVPANIWICVTHTFCAPHLLGGPALEQASEADKYKGMLLEQALFEAVRHSVEAAKKSLVPVSLWLGKGESRVNVNRDIPSQEGWWIGLNPNGFSNHQLTTLKFADESGKTVALLYHYGMQPSIMDNVFDDNGCRMVSGDIAGYVSSCLEWESGDGQAAIFLPGGCGDQGPREKARYLRCGEKGKLEEINLGAEAGVRLVAKLGEELAADIRSIRHEQKLDVSAVKSEFRCVNCPKQKKSFDGFPVPSLDWESIPDGELGTEVFYLHLGSELVLVGVMPELNSSTAAAVELQSPCQNTILVQMVNGGQKYMADQAAYEKRAYQAMNSFFGKGAAEQLTREIIAYL